MKIKTSELIDAPLRWAVAICEGWVDSNDRAEHTTPGEELDRFSWQMSRNGVQCFLLDGKMEFFTDWSLGGPIIDREKIWLKFPFMVEGDTEAIHGAFGFPNVVNAFGPTALIAAMRCHVASRLGEYVDVPEEISCQLK